MFVWRDFWRERDGPGRAVREVDVRAVRREQQLREAQQRRRRERPQRPAPVPIAAQQGGPRGERDAVEPRDGDGPALLEALGVAAAAGAALREQHAREVELVLEELVAGGVQRDGAAGRPVVHL